MALPKQIQQQAEAAAQIEEQLKAASEPTPATTDPADPPPEPNGNSPTADTTVASTPPANVTPIPQHDDLQHKYSTLQGMYNSTVRKLNDLVDRVKGLEQENAALRQGAEPDASDTPLVSPKDVETFGEDLIDLARRIAKDEFRDREAAYNRRIASLEAQLGTKVDEVRKTQAQSAEEVFFDKLTARRPDWETVQAQPDCQQWLRSRPPGSPYTWDELLKAAAAAHDVGRVLEIFDAFDAAHPKPVVSTPQVKPSNELQRQVAPGKSKAGSTATADKPIYSYQQYEQESMKIIRLRKAGQYEDAQRLEQELNAAFAEGRVRP